MAVVLALVVSVAEADSASAAESRASKFLRREGQRLNSPELTVLAQEASEASHKVDPRTLDSVKDMIRNMLAQKMADHAEDTTKKAFCDKESKSANAKVEKLKDEMEKAQADLDKLQAVLAETKDDIVDLHSDLAKLQKSKNKATEIRDKEHENYEAQKAIDDAATPAEGEDARSAQILAGVKKEQAEADKAFKYKRMMSAMDEDIVRKTKSAKDKDSHIIKMNRDISDAENDFRMLQEELAAATTYQEQISHQCIVRDEPAKERQARRHEEIASLKDAYGVLTGADIPDLSA
eukprot:gnl/TRDRNA2_/TRDRNA2_185820_c0_seq1.p1 gnl/TRDRNA2_/TRDRNA2_185820_c0~~gnl/TRDRNA2_/TRDRNA2_185820_c0_seq1.p1  ORF type:complete len:319 (-),score=108.51 gnl/TRDRNA2_/TRDRNA2_185820_c0_seq1:133-1011(-)